MKLPTLLLALFLIAATLPLFPEKEYIYPVYAEDATSSPTRQNKITRFNDRVEKRKESVATRSAALKAKRLRFKDQVKAKRVENINDRLDKINENRTTIMLEHIEKIKDILENMEEKVDSAAADGKD